MSLSWEGLDTESFDDTGETVTLGDTNNVTDIVVFEDLIDFDFLFEQASGEVDFFGDGTTVDLDFEDVSLFGSVVELADESVADNSDNGAVLLDSVKVLLEATGLDFLLVLGEGLFLGSVPVLVESSLEFFTEVLSPDSGESSHTTWGVDVADKTDDLHGGSLNNGSSFDDLLFVESGPGTVDFSHDVGHTSLEPDKGGQVWLLRSVVTGERSDSAPGVFGSSSWHETQVSSSWSSEFSVRHTAL